jgi:ABC-2 type transport system ATP-binding protein
VWEVSVPHAEVSKLERMGRLITSRKEGGQMIARVVATDSPAPGARLVDPELEDAYVTVRMEATI